MRRWLLLISFLPLWAISVHAQFVNKAVAENTGNSTTTSATNMTGATLLVAQVNSFVQTSTLAISDSSSNTWVPLTRIDNVNAVNTLQMFYVCNPTVSSTQTFTGTTSNSFVQVFILGWAGSQASCFDAESTAQTANPTTTAQPGSITPAQAGELFVTAAANSSVTTTAISINSSFTITDEIHSGAVETAGLAYFVNTGSGALNPTWTFTNNEITQAMSAAMASFKLNAATGGSGKQVGGFLVGP